MTSEVLTRHPDILWAEGPGHLWLTVVLPEKCLYDFRLSKERMIFKGHSEASPSKKYGFELEFKEEVMMKDSESREYGYNLFIEVPKKTPNVVWGRLTKSPKKNVFVKTDFSRYKDPEAYGEPEFDDKLDIDRLVKGMISQKRREIRESGTDLHGMPKFKIEDNYDFMERRGKALTEEETQSLDEEESRLKMSFMRDAAEKQEQEEEEREGQERNKLEEDARKDRELANTVYHKMTEEVSGQDVVNESDYLNLQQ